MLDGLKNLFKVGIKAGSEHYKALAALNDLNLLLMAPVFLRNSVIVIDDIERKHERLGIDEVLGFIDEYSKQHGARFVLVLNDDQLSSHDAQKKLWATFREKVIDQEIRLTTSAEEAFSIAMGLVPSKYAEAIKRPSISCGLTNIRVIVKVIKAVNLVLGDHDLMDAIQARVVPSIVLFSAIHYRGLDDGPDFQFALKAGSPDWSGFGRDGNTEPTEEEKREDRWRLLMQELGIYGCDKFERILVDFLESGLFDIDGIKAVINGYVTETQSMEAREVANQFLKRVFWDHRIDDAQLVTEAAALPGIAGLLDPFTASELDQALEKLPNGSPIGKAIVDGWIAAFHAKQPTEVNDENMFNRPLQRYSEQLKS